MFSDKIVKSGAIYPSLSKLYASSLIFLLALCKNIVVLPIDKASTPAEPYEDCFLIFKLVGVIGSSAAPDVTVNSPPVVITIKVLVALIEVIAFTWLEAIV